MERYGFGSPPRGMRSRATARSFNQTKITTRPSELSLFGPPPSCKGKEGESLQPLSGQAASRLLQLDQA